MTKPKKIVPQSFPIAENLDEVEDMLQNFSSFTSLTSNQRAVLMAICEDMFLEQGVKRRTNTQLAKDCGISYSGIGFILANPRFNTALGMLTIAVARGKSHIYLSAMEKLALKGHYSAIKFLLEYGGTYTKRSEVKTQNLNVNVNQGRPQNFDEAVDYLLISLGSQGWSASQIVERYNTLKAENAF